MKYNKKSLRFLILGVFGLITLFFILGIIFIMQSKSLLYNEKVNYLEEISVKSAENIQEQISGHILTLDTISTSIANNEDLDIQNSLQFLAEEAKKSNFKRMGIILPNGTAYTTDGMEFDFSNRAYFHQAMMGKSSVSNTLIDKVDNYQINVIASPIQQNDKIIGVIFATKTQEGFSEMMTIESFNGEGHSYIINSNGNAVIQINHPHSLGAFENLFTSMSLDNVNKDDLEKMKTDIRNGKNGSFRNNSDSENSQICYTKVGINDWYIVSTVPSNVISRQSDKLILELIILTISIVLISSIISFLLIMNYQKHNKNLEKLAYVDRVTDYSNWSRFSLDAQTILASSSDDTYAMISLDIKKFKVINDMFGHDTGNKILRAIGDIINDNIDNTETFARVSSDNFNILIRHKDDGAIVRRLQKIAEEIENMINDYKIEVSVGIYPINDKTLDINILSDRAAVAKNIAKRKNDIFYHFFREENRIELIREKEIENSMEAALYNKEFEVYLQPKYLIATETIVGAEALVRWNRGNLGIIPPNDFIPLFEKNGFVRKLDLYMFEQVCKLIHKWETESNNVLIVPISVNISRVHLSDQNLPTKLLSIAKKYQISPKLLEIELTENAVFLDVDNMIKIMGKIKDAGFLLSIDDFGSGYSSLRVLKDLPADYVKIDKGFLDKAVNNKRGEEIIVNIISMIKGLGLYTIAEGVETYDQLTFLKNAGCDIAQGYYYSRPIPVAEFEKIIKED